MDAINRFELLQDDMGTSSEGVSMYATKSVNGIPAIQRNGRSVLSVWAQDWDFAYELCELLNEQEKSEPALLLNPADRKWLAAMDHAFKEKVQHV